MDSSNLVWLANTPVTANPMPVTFDTRKSRKVRLGEYLPDVHFVVTRRCRKLKFTAQTPNAQLPESFAEWINPELQGTLRLLLEVSAPEDDSFDDQEVRCMMDKLRRMYDTLDKEMMTPEEELETPKLQVYTWCCMAFFVAPLLVNWDRYVFGSRKELQVWGERLRR